MIWLLFCRLVCAISSSFFLHAISLTVCAIVLNVVCPSSCPSACYPPAALLPSRQSARPPTCFSTSSQVSTILWFMNQIVITIITVVVILIILLVVIITIISISSSTSLLAGPLFLGARRRTSMSAKPGPPSRFRDDATSLERLLGNVAERRARSSIIIIIIICSSSSSSYHH